jgi:hypothetical protein
MTIDFIAMVPCHRSHGVMVPHTPRLFQDTATHRRQKDGRWLLRCWELLRITGGRKTTDPRN